MKTTIEIPDGLLKEGETLEYREPRKGERFITDKYGVVTSSIDLIVQFPVVITPFNKEEWANTNLPIPRKKCWAAMDAEGWWYCYVTKPYAAGTSWVERTSFPNFQRMSTMMKDTKYPVDWKDSLFHFNGTEWEHIN